MHSRPSFVCKFKFKITLAPENCPILISKMPLLVVSALNTFIITMFQTKKSTQRRRKHCTLAVVRRSQKFSPVDGHYLYLQTEFGEEKFRITMVTDPHTHTHTHPQTGPITIHCAAASAQCKKYQLV